MMLSWTDYATGQLILLLHRLGGNTRVSRLLAYPLTFLGGNGLILASLDMPYSSE
jgi:hypothetical protein